MVMRIEAGGPIAPAKLNAATNASVAACDLLDGVKDGLIRDPLLRRGGSHLQARRGDADVLDGGRGQGDQSDLGGREEHEG